VSDIKERTGRKAAECRASKKANLGTGPCFVCQVRSAATFASGLLRTEESHPTRTAVALSTDCAFAACASKLRSSLTRRPGCCLLRSGCDEYAGAGGERG
jgi:hypothetical protein